MRLDQRLVQLKLTPSRVKAQELIQKGHVLVSRNGSEKSVNKPSYKTLDDDHTPGIINTSIKVQRKKFITKNNCSLGGDESISGNSFRERMAKYRRDQRQF